MRALSIRQPWVWAILYAEKRIENRLRPIRRYPQRIWLHAAKRMTHTEYDVARDFIGERGFILPPRDQLMLGGVVGMAEIVGCVAKSSDPWFNGPYGWVLDKVEPVPFMPCRGMLGLFEPDFNASAKRGNSWPSSHANP